MSVTAGGALTLSLSDSECECVECVCNQWKIFKRLCLKRQETRNSYELLEREINDLFRVSVEKQRLKKTNKQTLH